MSPEAFTDEQINGPKNVLGYPEERSHSTREKSQSVFEITAPGVSPELIALLRLGERAGAYSQLSEKYRRILEMRYVEGLNISQIGDVMGVSKQSVSQSLRLSPESLFRKMTRDVVMSRTDVPFPEIYRTYTAYKKTIKEAIRRR